MARAELIFYFACAFLFGVFSASLGLAFLLCAVSLGGAISYWIFKKRRLALIVMCGALVGFGYYFVFESAVLYSEHIPTGNTQARAMVTEVRSRDRVAQRLQLELLAPYRGRIRATLKSFPELHYGTEIVLHGTFVGRNRLSDYSEIVHPSFEVIATGRGSLVKARLVSLRDNVLLRVQSFFTPDVANFLGGITLGARDSLSPELKNQLALSGTTHVVALSGYNIGILVFFISNLLSLFFRRIVRFWLTILIIILFVLMTGTQASIIRAALMGILALIASQSGRIYSLPYAIVYSAFLMVLGNPALLRFDLGFQLSFLSLMGISYITPALQSLFGSEEGFLFWKSNVLATAGAQLAVLPVVIAAFHSFSLTSLLANVLILPFIPLSMGLGFFVIAVSFVSHYAAMVISWIPAFFLNYELGVIRFFALWRWPLHIPFENWIVSCAYYCTLTAFVFGVTSHKNLSSS